MAEQRYFRKIIKIKATDSPNVRLGLAQVAIGISPTDEVLVPGVLTYGEYAKRRMLWDKVRQCKGLDAEFWEGASSLLYPSEWLNYAERFALELSMKVDNAGNPIRRIAKAIGVDTAEGGDDTAMSAVDEWGLIEQVWEKTPDTNVIVGRAAAFGRKHGAPPENWMFDRGGGGKQAADRLRAQGLKVRTIGFGESPTSDDPTWVPPTDKVKEALRDKEERYIYKDRRAQMYHQLRLLMELDHAGNPIHPSGHGFGIPAMYTELREEMAPIPLTEDDLGHIYLLPKHARSNEPSLVSIIGHSPDKLDSLVLAVHGMLHTVKKQQFWMR